MTIGKVYIIPISHIGTSSISLNNHHIVLKNILHAPQASYSLERSLIVLTMEYVLSFILIIFVSRTSVSKDHLLDRCDSDLSKLHSSSSANPTEFVSQVISFPSTTKGLFSS